jgi:ethanolamine utilization protein EutN
VFLARVIGRVVATRRVAGLAGERLLIVRPLDETGEGVGDSLVACDVVDSGPGDLVHVCDGREAALALRERFVPIDATIVGHVEQFAHNGPTAADRAASAGRGRRRRRARPGQGEGGA